MVTCPRFALRRAEYGTRVNVSTKTTHALRIALSLHGFSKVVHVSAAPETELEKVENLDKG